MIGPQTLLDLEIALREREREIDASARQAWMIADASSAGRGPRLAVAAWLRAVAARLEPLPSEPKCCAQPA
jgi:hypothetical protein